MDGLSVTVCSEHTARFLSQLSNAKRYEKNLDGAKEDCEKALKILRKVGETFNIPTVTDIHKEEDAALAAAYVDVLQIPAFLVRQTDLIVAAAQTGKTVNLKKGQFMECSWLLPTANCCETEHI